MCAMYKLSLIYYHIYYIIITFFIYKSNINLDFYCKMCYNYIYSVKERQRNTA